MAVLRRYFILAWFPIVVLVSEGRSFGQALCNVSAVPNIVRSEGLTEATGTIVLNGCSGSIPSSGVTLTVNMLPATAIITNSPNPNGLPTATVTTTSGGIATSTTVMGSIGTASTVASFSIPATPAGATLTSIQIGIAPGVASSVGIRVNAFGTGITSLQQITASLGASPGSALALNSSIVTVGVPVVALFATVTQGASIFQGAPPALTNPPSTATFSAGPSFTAIDSLTLQAASASSIPQINIAEGFAGALRLAGAPASGNGEGVDGSGIGTRVLIQLINLPTTTVVYAPQLIQTTTVGGSLALALVSGADANGAGGSVVAGASPIAANLITGSAITYETVANSTLFKETATIPLGIFTVPPSNPNVTCIFSTGTQFTCTQQATPVLTVTANVFVAPISSVTNAAPTTVAPIPRFANVQAALATAPGSPNISLSSSMLNFNVPVGSTTSPQTLTISNGGGGILNWSAAINAITGGNWLSLSQTSGTANSSVSISVSSASLPVGTYNATVLVSAVGATNTPQTFTVSLNVTPTSLSLNTSSLSFNAPSGTSPPPQQLTILTSGGILSWSAAVSSSGGNWLSLSAALGITPTTVSVLVNTAGLSPGNYQGTITVTAPGSSNSQTVTVTLVLGTPTISLNPASLVFVASSGKNPPSQTFEVDNVGGGVLGWTATVATQSGENWLSASPTSAVAPSTVTVTVSSAGLPQGGYHGTITIAALPGSLTINSPQILTVTLTIDAPLVESGGVVNAASYAKDPGLSPGSIVSIFGVNLATTTAAATTATLPTSLGTTQVLINESAAPLFYVSSTQINFQMPPGVSGPSAQLIVVSNGVRGTAVTVNVVLAAPGIFTVSSTGTGQGAILNEDFSPNSIQNPAEAGSVIEIYATGLGATNPPAVGGQPAPTSPLSVTLLTPVVLVGGNPAEVLSSDLAPNFVGAYQVNARVPAGTPSGSAVTVQIQVAISPSLTVTSNVVNIAVK